MTRYPSKIETLIESEHIIFNMDNVFCSERVIKKKYNNKLYVLQWCIYRIRGCLVFDLEGNLIDHYDNGAFYWEHIYKKKTYYQWVDMFENR